MSLDGQKQLKVRTVYSKEDIHIFTDLGLGRGVDATNPKPWINRSEFQVQEATQCNVIGTEEGNLYRSFHDEIASSLHLQTSLSASIPANQLVSISVDGELSRDYSTSQISFGAKIVTRTISFLTGFENNDDENFSNFEKRLIRWILNELGQVYHKDEIRGFYLFIYLMKEEILKELCYNFIKTFSVTHYVHSLELGASCYQVVSNSVHQTKISHNTMVSAQAMAAVSGGVEGVFEGRRFQKKYSSIGHMNSTATNFEEQPKIEHTRSKILSRILSPTVERNTIDEAVVGIKVEPVSSLVKNPYLREILQNALQQYIQNQRKIKCEL